MLATVCVHGGTIMEQGDSTPLSADSANSWERLGYSNFENVVDDQISHPHPSAQSHRQLSREENILNNGPRYNSQCYCVG